MSEEEAMVHARVLIVTERREKIRAAAARLAAEGYEVRIMLASAGELARPSAPWPELVLLCFEGPPRADLLADVRCRWSAPLLVWAGSSSQAEAVQALQAGADDYVGGPLALDELAARVVAQLRRAQWRGPASRTAWQPAC